MDELELVEVRQAVLVVVDERGQVEVAVELGQRHRRILDPRRPGDVDLPVVRPIRRLYPGADEVVEAFRVQVERPVGVGRRRDAMAGPEAAGGLQRLIGLHVEYGGVGPCADPQLRLAMEPEGNQISNGRGAISTTMTLSPAAGSSSIRRCAPSCQNCNPMTGVRSKAVGGSLRFSK